MTIKNKNTIQTTAAFTPKEPFIEDESHNKNLPPSFQHKTTAEHSLWLPAREIFEALFDLDENEHIQYIEQACTGKPELKKEVEKLIHNQKHSEKYLQELLHKTEPILRNCNPIGNVFNGYKLLKLLGHGGMGSVYLANRIDGDFDRQVAVKLVNNLIDNNAMLERFRRERHILAGLEHANITQLIDAGKTQDGRLFFIMEYVQGPTIDQYCQDFSLSINARLKLFLKVCSAVSFAHQKLVLHKDLKPQNILVNTEGVPKLLDFGIAQFLTNDSKDKVFKAEMTARIMTPLYASPEQIQQQELSTASDQYSLAVVLYQLLTGHLPYPETRNLLDLENHIVETQPTLPSKTVQSNQDSLNNRKLSHLLQGDLDNILLKALSKDPSQRYLSVQEFASDIQRYLNGLPIVARRSTILYRSSKFIKRNRVETLFSLFIFFLVVSTITLDRYRVSQIASEQTRKAEETQMINDFLLDLFTVSDSQENAALEKNIIDTLLKRGSNRLDQNFNQNSNLHASMLSTLGQIYQRLGMLPQALPLFQKGLQVSHEQTGNNDDEIALGLNNVGLIYRDMGQYEKSLSYLLKAQKIEHKLGEDRQRYSGILGNVGYVYRAKGQYQKSIGYFKQSLEITIRLNGPLDEGVGIINNHLGLSYLALKQHAKSISHFTTAIEVFKQIKPEFHPDIAISEGNLGKVYRESGKFEQSLVLLKSVASTFTKHYGPSHPHVATALIHLSRTHYELKQFNQAIEIAQKALSIRQEVYEEPHPFVSECWHYLGLFNQGIGKVNIALSFLQKAYISRVRLLGSEHPDTQLSKTALEALNPSL